MGKNHAGMWSIGWVGSLRASPECTVTDRFDIAVSPDGMAARLRVCPGPPGEAADLAVYLKTRLGFGLDSGQLEEIGEQLRDPRYRFDGVIAAGLQPVDGTAARLDFDESLQQRVGTESALGRMDFHDRGLLNSVSAGDVIGEWQAAVSSRAGCTVTGDVLPGCDPPARALPRLGPGIERRDDGTLVAGRDGVFALVPGRQSDIVDYYQHPGDVDLESGNLGADGSILVKGSVGVGLVVRATGDVVVRGSVYQGRISAGANLVVCRGAIGHGTELDAGGDAECRFIADAAVTAGGLLTITDHAVNSRLTGARVEATGGRGHVVGGVTRARRLILLAEAGSTGGARTVLRVADPSIAEPEIRRRENDLTRRLRQANRGRIRSGSRGKSGKVGRDVAIAERRLRDLRRAVARDQRAALIAAEVIVTRRLHLGVEIYFGKYCYELTDELRAVRFWFDPDEERIREEPWKP